MRVIGDLHGVTAAAAGRCIHDVSNAICSKVSRFIQWPDNTEVLLSKRNFYDYTNGFPNILGAIDGTHVPINGPHYPSNESAFVNRKSFHSINCQILCNSEMKIYDMDARWPGSCHDSYILRNSTVFEKFESGTMGNTLILGDSGYALSRWLMVPFNDPRTSAEERYNTAHKKGRCIVERCNGLLKMRFRCLTKPIMFQPTKASKIVGACGALHNFAIEKRIQLNEEIESDIIESLEIHETYRESTISSDGNRTRSDIVRRVFS